jgi:glucokinase
LSRDSQVTDIADAARSGDGLARELFALAGRALGMAFANVATFTGLDLIIIGGGMAPAWPLMAEAARAAMNERLHMIDPAKLDIQLTQLGNDAPILGAAAIARGM